MDEEREVMGFLAADGVLYCSEACARRNGKSGGSEVDQDEYDGLVANGEAGGVALCPGCGAEFPVEWAERERG